MKMVVLLIGFALASVHFAEAQQQGTIPRIGFVSAIGTANNPGLQIEAFRQGLRDLGYIVGKNIDLEYRFIEGKRDQIVGLVAELVKSNVDVLVVGTTALRAAKAATKTVPIVMVVNTDPVAAGLVDSLARPGGNITGLTRLDRDLNGKRLELLLEVVPRMSAAGVLWDAEGPATGFQEYESAARTLKIRFRSLPVRGSQPDFEEHFEL